MREVPEDQVSTQLTVLIANSPYKGYFLERNRQPPCAGSMHPLWDKENITVQKGVRLDFIIKEYFIVEWVAP